MRVLFAGSPVIAVPSLVRLSVEHEVAGVLTNPESAQGRGLAVARTAVAQTAAVLFGESVPVLAFERLGPEARAAVAALRPEILVTFAYGRIFGPRFLALFPRGGVNVHPSLLPRYRGPTPIPFAIMNRESETGITVQRLALEMDSGDILGVEKLPLRGTETTDDLTETAALLGADLLSRVLQDIAAGREAARPQEGQPSYCSLLNKEDGLIDWGAPVLDIDAKIRAYSPWPGAFTWYRGQRLGLLESVPYPGPESEEPRPGTLLGLDKRRGLMVKTVDGELALRRLQIQNKKALPYRDFANGIRDLAGVVLGLPSPEEADRP
ncbi:MAG: methionyl-tRNA formyltransferase [Spirochaetaceae bacterium]|nr:methionyl-tRNA formyltransferase [Spirochaetaceae bacterium]